MIDREKGKCFIPVLMGYCLHMLRYIFPPFPEFLSSQTQPKETVTNFIFLTFLLLNRPLGGGLSTGNLFIIIKSPPFSFHLKNGKPWKERILLSFLSYVTFSTYYNSDIYFLYSSCGDNKTIFLVESYHLYCLEIRSSKDTFLVLNSFGYQTF